VYLGNLARQQNGVPPLRWNRQLSDAARWFAWDSTENRAPGFCDHQDTNGQWPSDRALIFGYLGQAGAENAFCGYVTPQQAIDGWMESDPHRGNLLDPASREIGLGYHRRDSDGWGYVVQDFGTDPVFPPVIIENEALTTTTESINLYIYDRAPGGGFTDFGPATQMRISNEPCFLNAPWEPYTPNKTWSLVSGQGWRQVYVQTTDSLSRTSTVSDTIYLGANLPLDQLSLTQASTTRDHVTLYSLDGNGLPFVQFSLSWFVDDTFDTFGLNWGNGQQVTDPTALGGTAFRLETGAGESKAWVWTTQFVKDTPLVAYVRLKVDDNSETSEVARFSVSGGGVEYGPISIAGTDFTSAGQYQEFPLDFTYNDDPSNVFLILNFWRSGETNVYVDGVYIFTTPMPITSPFQWDVPGSHYRGQGVWVRYTDGGTNFSSVQAASPHPPPVSVSPPSLFFMAAVNEPSTLPQTLSVSLGCQLTGWQAATNVNWLQIQQLGALLQVRVDATGLSTGNYNGEITIQNSAEPTAPTVSVPVNLLVVENVHRVFFPLTQK